MQKNNNESVFEINISRGVEKKLLVPNSDNSKSTFHCSFGFFVKLYINKINIYSFI
jgi:hypothetical protein